jgi:hypothetical protein
MSARLKFLMLIGLVICLLACNAVPLGFLAPTPTPKPKPTRTSAPTKAPKPTATLAPTATFTLEPVKPTNSPAVSPTANNQPPPTSAVTLAPDKAIRVYYINKDEQGAFGCNEQLWYINTRMPKTGNVALDVKSALSVILSYHGQTIGKLYNGGYASTLGVSEVQYDGSKVTVYLTGTYTRTKDRCDGPRLRDQLRQTIKQFDGVSDIAITINGTPIADVIARK